MSKEYKEKPIFLIDTPDISTDINNTQQVVNNANSNARIWIRIAGVSGAIGIMMAAYGAHHLPAKSGITPERLKIFNTGTQFHFIDTLAMLAVPFSTRPKLTGFLMLIGMLVFCGTCYVTGLTGCTKISALTPWGGIATLLAWITFAL